MKSSEIRSREGNEEEFVLRGRGRGNEALHPLHPLQTNVSKGLVHFGRRNRSATVPLHPLQANVSKGFVPLHPLQTNDCRGLVHFRGRKRAATTATETLQPLRGGGRAADLEIGDAAGWWVFVGG